MQELKRKFEDNYLLGCIKYNGKCSIYLMPIAWWILNYSKYDPTYNPKDWQNIFRDDILNVTDDKIEQFFKAIEGDKINLDEFKLVIDFIPVQYKRIHFFIDFDNKILINGFYDIEVEEYLPDTTWEGRFESPIKYLPKELKLLF